MSHIIAVTCADASPPYDYAHNRRLCEALMNSSTALLVLQMDGTDQSVGVAAEIAYMQAQNKPVWDLYKEDDGWRFIYRHSVIARA